jgi:TctA family transporter
MLCAAETTTWHHCSLAFELGGLFEPNVRQGLIVGYGDPLAFVRSPISASMLAASLAAILGPVLWQATVGSRSRSTAERA